ncbi:uncharacterized protein LOC127808578 [Diospyros lotus]|uniref:uncharacterized protein LOC127808578 n=1 Tax=Diospyros lotus TaxID=55363 RepID=UPI00225050CF|nr:uncharacterized protein LOC127808578 [Diospyros lotus]
MEKIFDVLEHIPESLPKGCSEEGRVTWEEMRDQDLRVRTYILASMTNELQRQHEHMTDTRRMIMNLQELYGEHSWMVRYEIYNQLFKENMAEGTDVGDHVLKMVNLIGQLEVLDFYMDVELQIDLIFQLLLESFTLFILNFNMNKLE